MSGSIIIDMTVPANREYVHLAALKGAISLEAKGMKRSRGLRSARSIAREEGYRGNAEKQMTAIAARMEELLKEREA